MTALRHLPVNDLLDVTHNFEQLQNLLTEQERELRVLQSTTTPKLPEVWKLASALGFEHAWENFEAARKAEYRKNPFGTVELRGVLKAGETGRSAFILPVGYRPKEEKVFLESAAAVEKFGRVNVMSSGAVVPENGTGEVKVFVYLEASFSVE